MTRPIEPHNHIFHTEDDRPDCAACRLIRPEVMSKRAIAIISTEQTPNSIFGPPRNPAGDSKYSYIPDTFDF